MTLIDISQPLGPDTLVFPGDPPVGVVPCTAIAPGDPESFATSLLTLCTHAGTHLDPPSHFIPGGASVDELPLEWLCGPARVLDLRGCGPRLDAELLASFALEGVERLLLRTDNEALQGQPYCPDHAGLTADAATYLRQHTGVRLVGIDYLSIENGHEPGFPVHRTLLAGAAPTLILEGLVLSQAPAGDHELLCLPLRLVGGDGGPARAVLRPWPR